MATEILQYDWIPYSFIRLVYINVFLTFHGYLSLIWFDCTIYQQVKPIQIFLIARETNIDLYSDDKIIYKRHINKNSIDNFKTKLSDTDWDYIQDLTCPNQAYDRFLNGFMPLYNEAFPKVKIKVKHKSLLSPWMSKALLKSSKTKHKLYNKFLKNKTYRNESTYKIYKNLFEKLKLKSKTLYYSKQLKKFEHNTKRTWAIIKEVINKTKTINHSLPRRLIKNNKTIFNKEIIAETFNEFFINIGPNLASKIKTSSNKSFHNYLKNSNSVLTEYCLSDKEFEEAFFSLKINKSAGYDDINYNVIKEIFQHIHRPLKHIFNLSITKGIFPEKLKIARVTPVFKAGENTEVSNYRPISVLPCFSKILEKIMYNRLYSYLCENNILYEKQFGFQKQTSTEHAILQLTDDLHKNFNENKFTIGVFIDLSKAFDTVDHKILLEKLNYYGIHGHYHTWFTNYLKNRKQFIEYETGKQTNTLTIKCGVPQGSILGPLLFLLYINDLAQASRILKAITFADDTNLFYAHENINILFQNVNIELQNLCDWFSVNKLSLNNDKTKYTFFHKPSISDYIPLKLPPLYINNKIIKRSEHIRFLGIILDENLTWKKHINTIESKIAKNIGALYRAKFLLNQKCLKNIYFAFIHSYINYGNIAWASTNYTQLRKLHNKQKHASRIIFNQDKNTHARPLMKKLKALNIYQLNIYQTLILMYKSLNNSSPKVFQNKFKNVKHKYPTHHSQENLVIPRLNLKSTRFSISYRGPYLWNRCLDSETKKITTLFAFKKAIKKILLNFQDEISYF